LLRVLQEGRVRPLGSDTEHSIDVRVLSATNLDLESLADRGAYRPDLIARLAPLRLDLPPLSRRREEIIALWTECISTPLAVEAAEALLLFSWLRNVREVQSTAEEARLLAGDAPRIELEHLPSRLRTTVPAVDSETHGPPERDVLIASLSEHRGNVAEVARALGQTRQTVYRWMSVYRLTPDRFRKS
jgi:transcriptional regulator of acetoin/glycerol metabolism